MAVGYTILISTDSDPINWFDLDAHTLEDARVEAEAYLQRAWDKREYEPGDVSGYDLVNWLGECAAKEEHVTAWLCSLVRNHDDEEEISAIEIIDGPLREHWVEWNENVPNPR